MRTILSLTTFLILLFFSTPSFAVTTSFTAVEDSFISETDPTHNFGSDTALLADGDDGFGGELATIIKWDVSSIPSNAIVTAASIKLNLFDSSGGPYNIIRQNTAWSEGTVNWSHLSGSALVRGIIPAFSLGQVTIPLNEHGINLVQGWLDGGFVNNGITIRTAGTTNGIDMDSRESGGFSPTLEVTYTSEDPTISELLARIVELENLLAGVTRTGDNLNFDGMNVRIRNGNGATNSSVNGLGNLIIGYNESFIPINNESFPMEEENKSGSHNIVLGAGHNYSSYGGIVSGYNNAIMSPYANVTGGRQNQALEDYSSISGGHLHIANGNTSSISGGFENLTAGNASSVSGGRENRATVRYASVSGGFHNFSIGEATSISGGRDNRADNHYSSISGGKDNEALRDYATVNGGFNNIARADFSTVNGGRYNIAEGMFSTIGGGNERTASGEDDWVAGSLFEDN